MFCMFVLILVCLGRCETKQWNQECKDAVWFVPYGLCNTGESQIGTGFVPEKSVGLLNIRLLTAGNDLLLCRLYFVHCRYRCFCWLLHVLWKFRPFRESQYELPFWFFYLIWGFETSSDFDVLGSLWLSCLTCVLSVISVTASHQWCFLLSLFQFYWSLKHSEANSPNPVVWAIFFSNGNK